MAGAEDPEIFPRYKMIISGEEHWLELKDAGITYDSAWVPVEIGGLVLESTGVTRVITTEERALIKDIADDWSGSK